MQYLRRDALCKKLGNISKSGFAELLKGNPDFPRSVRFSQKMVLWEESEVEKWMHARREAQNPKKEAEA